MARRIRLASASSRRMEWLKENLPNSVEINVKPLADRVIIEPAAAQEKTAGGIIIPDTAKEKPKRGKIIAAGNGKKDEPLTVKEGDTVRYGQYSGTEIKIEATEYLILSSRDILAKVS